MIRSTTEEEHGAEDYETQYGDDFDRGKPELRLAVDADCKDIEKNNGGEYDCDPCCNGSVTKLPSV